MQRSWRTLLPLAILAVLVGYLYVHRHPAVTPPIATPTAQPESGAASPAPLPAFLPPEARETLALIARGGPFPHRQDGVVFGNYERLLPAEPRGYYHEYTVETPGAHDRGARRIITGGNPPEVYYYTDDHYRSFREFTVPR
ncbi:MAG TPA: ribonuclease domain-containing protein [Rhodanobacteraceae bacterium]|nr:ribonuclease domain-containing protein [Rhodanobacteraceae bacterium]